MFGTEVRRSLRVGIADDLLERSKQLARSLGLLLNAQHRLIQMLEQLLPVDFFGQFGELLGNQGRAFIGCMQFGIGRKLAIREASHFQIDFGRVPKCALRTDHRLTLAGSGGCLLISVEITTP